MSLFDRLQPTTELTEAETEAGLRWMLRNGIFSQAMEAIALGPVLIAYALHFGASNFAIGLLAALPNLAQFAQLPSVQLVERVRKRRLLAVIFSSISRPMLLIMAAAVLVPSQDVALAMVLVGLTLRYAFGGVVACSWNSWVRDLVPENRMGTVFADRFVWNTAVAMVVSLAAGLFVDTWGQTLPEWRAEGSALLLVIAFLFGCGSVYCMSRMTEPAMPPAEKHLPLYQRLAEPLRDANFRNLVAFLGSWHFSINLATPFFTVYMYKRLGLSVTMVTVLLTVSLLANISVLRTWGRIADKMAHKSVITVAAPLFALSIFLWIFLPDNHVMTIPLLVIIHLLAGVSAAGVTLASNNIELKLAPKGAAAAYLTVASMVTCVAAGVAPVIGGLTADWFADRELSLILQWTDPAARHVIQAINLSHWDFFFLFAAFLAFLSLNWLRLVREVGEVEEDIVVAELYATARQGMRNLTSVAGLRAAVVYPVELMYRRVRLRAYRAMRPRGPKPADGPDDPPT